ncbi:hypothetical protein CO101_01595 [Candidatus Berkelbacteria bacterium CG_4_9_14_3_um_filter_39_23]|uniref:YoaR-like putative peptidoglycan binding domain-containing protein n=2 Tax=Candidatus Berkelbacteria TaxID=1618330 RepID=A0A2M7CHK3_9BACT|nr:MAG: hypothetical protein AUK14_00620 [Candidatus Berkelbacteria bacterium CG2_30_39_44]PIR27874.1 MAG: hypothetical protein COV39_02210 [Candidatus Berkelbacteria bacterium CG11_big_fil_rev_8_21_14_0_20_40_23]PIV25109.1 MAG: hypothetical protein COS38_03375 [Candidatus Berkelbacteria bacterium CG03_land_8_20_14_0_80_40_36]PIZ28591.1 MAG: hypothetical protein COY44_03395 [Candidatus Berkelbacteria bacterium CG_4_10_14_0_8_um_filter_39_42]PJB51603.1 MAG: hypothetical protein CO101_01595 [Cand
MKKIIKKICAIIGFTLIAIIALGSLLLGITNYAYANRVLPRVYLGNEYLGGKTFNEVKKVVETNVSHIGPKIIFTNGVKSWSIDKVDIGLNVNGSQTATQALDWGRDDSIIQSFIEQFTLLVKPSNVAVAYTINQAELDKKIESIAQEIDKIEKDATLIVQDGTITEQDAEEGVRLNKEKISGLIARQINTFSSEAIPLPIGIITPKVYREGLSNAKNKLEYLIKNDIELVNKENKYQVSKEQIYEWLDLFASSARTDNRGYVLEVSLNQEKVKAYLVTLAGTIDQDSVNAKLVFRENKVSVFNPAQKGKKLDTEKALSMIEDALLNAKTQTIELPVAEVEPEISDAKINQLGLNEIIGKSTTSFAKSPANRIHNIKNGAAQLSGFLIEPNTEFSVVTRLGEVNDKSGYLPELVIKENRTVPEYGGGLCQVSTTLFRAALEAGLPIIERQNHSYRVSYYEPPVGLDATVYLPKPDLKFKNNTPGYILVQGYVEENNLTFELYGTKDGRVAKLEGPFTSGYIDPPNPIYTVTDTLTSGETKQIEKAHKGASSVVYYKVFDKDGKEINNQTFKSKYKAWPARFLVGKLPDNTENASAASLSE